MFDFKNASIQKKFTLGSVLVSSIVLILACFTFILYDYVNFRKDMVHNLLSLADITAQNTSATIVFDDPLSAQEVLKSLKFKPHIFGAYIYDANKRLFASYVPEIGHIPGDFENESQHFKEHITEDFKQKNWEFHKGFVEVFSFVFLDNEKVGRIIIVSDLHELAERIRTYILISVCIFLLSLQLVAFMSYYVARPISAPIRTLTSLVGKIAQGDLSQKIIIDSKDEVGTLGTSINRMVKDLNKAKEIEKEKQDLQHQLQQSQKLESIGTMANGIAHNFNNILGAIRGFVDMALVDAPKDSRMISDLTKAIKGIEDAKKLSSEMLSFSSMHEEELKAVKIHSAIQEGVDLFKASLASSVKLNVNIDTSCGPILAKLIDIKQIVLNLCNNANLAVKDKGGVIDVNFNEVEIDNAIASKHPNLRIGKYVRLTVRDNGKGMSQVTKDRIFEPFFTTRGVGMGTGLGLSTTHGIIKNYNGEVTVDSQPGQGSTFSVYLPLDKGDRKQLKG